MTEPAGSHRAAGFVYVHDVRADAQGLFFGRCGADPSDIDYRVTISERGSPARQVRLRVHGDFTQLRQSGILNDLGVRPLSVQVQANGKRFSADFEPDATSSGNALFRTTTGLHGAAIQTQSSDFGFVVTFAIFAAALVALTAIAVDVSVDVNATVTTPDGSADVGVHVGGDGNGNGNGNGNGGGAGNGT